MLGLHEGACGLADANDSEVIGLSHQVPGGRLVPGVRYRGAAGGGVPRAAVGSVPLQLGPDLRIARAAGRREPAQYRPAQLGTHGQAGDFGTSVEQPGEQVKLLGRGGSPAEQLRPGELVVTARLGRLQQTASRRRELLLALRYPVRDAGEHHLLLGHREQDLQQ